MRWLGSILARRRGGALRLRVAGAALLLGLACGDPLPGDPPSPAESSPGHLAIALDGVPFPDGGLPDPCEVLLAAGAPALLVRPLAAEPLRFEGLCLIEVDRGRRPEPQVSAALELAIRDRPQPSSLEDYVVDFGEGPILAGGTRDDLEIVPGLGDFAVWFPHEDGSLTLSAFWGGRFFLSVEVHGVDPAVAFDWSKALAEAVIARLQGDEA